MARFFMPRGAVAAYDRTARRLTILAGRQFTLGFRAVTQKEEDDVTVSASEPGAITARYRIAPLVTEFELDTSRPQRFVLTAERSEFMAASSSAIEPLEVVVYKQQDLSQVPAQGQDKDPTACWAACLAWWRTALSQSGRSAATMNDMLLKFAGIWSGDGTINVKAFHEGVRKNYAEFRMVTRDINPATLDTVLGFWPVVVGFRSPAGFGHMNVLFDYNPVTGRVKAMDPWYPDTKKLSDNEDGVLYLTDPDFRFTGIVQERSLQYYGQPAPGGGTLMVGMPEELPLRAAGLNVP